MAARQRSSEWHRIAGTSRNNPQYRNERTGDVKGKSFVDTLRAKEAGWSSRHQLEKARNDPVARRAIENAVKAGAKRSEVTAPTSKLLTDYRTMAFRKDGSERAKNTKESRKAGARLIRDGRLFDDPELLSEMRRRLGSPGRGGKTYTRIKR